MAGVGPLSDLKVIDVSAKGPGAFASMMLGDLGADVLVVEPAAQARPVTYVGTSPSVDSTDEQRAAAYDPLRRNKRFVTINLKDAEGLAILHQLVEKADVFLETYRPGVMDRLGLGSEELSKLNPRLIYCSITGFGQFGPAAGIPGHDINYVAFGGLLSMCAETENGPVPPMNLVADWAGGSEMAVIGILSAVYERQASGKGQHIDVGMTDGVLYLLANCIGEYYASGVVPRVGKHPLTGSLAHYGCYKCADGKWLSVGALEGKFYYGLLEAMCLDSAIGGDDLRRELTARFAERTSAEWFDLLGREHDLPVSPVLSLDEAVKEPHHIERQMVRTASGDSAHDIPQVGIAPRLSRTPGDIWRLGRTAGADNSEVFSELGLDEEKLTELRQRGVI
jgi:crotonobetainyl-CoA:carnitine CoA-transferase CaiB-like acyl-CoA transferase